MPRGDGDLVSDGAPRGAGAPAPTSLMTGSPPFGPERLVTLDHWQDPPDNRWSFQHVRELVPTARIARGSGPVWRLARRERDLSRVTFRSAGRRWTVGELLDESQTDGFLVLHRGDIVAEIYDNGMREDTVHLLQSVSKSITAAVAGCLVGLGALDVAAPVSDVLPELRGTSFDGATVQQLLDMRTGTRFNEDYDDPAADVRVFEQVYLWRPRVDADLPEDALSYFATLPNDAEHGGEFRYRSILTDVMSWVVERAGADRFHELVSRLVWSPMGAEFDAEITVDAHGNPMADGGISATLRDLGRFGQLYLRRGRRGRRPVLPAAWVDDTVRGARDGPSAFATGFESRVVMPGAHYRNYWWVDDPANAVLHASGIYGQNIFVHAPTSTVVVKLSTWPTPLDEVAFSATRAAVFAIGEHLERHPGSSARDGMH